MAEFGIDTLVIIADENENILFEKKVSDLLPGAFTPDDLK
jgi:cytidine deaminase